MCKDIITGKRFMFHCWHYSGLFWGKKMTRDCRKEGHTFRIVQSKTCCRCNKNVLLKHDSRYISNLDLTGSDHWPVVEIK